MNLKDIVDRTYNVGEEAFTEALKHLEYFKFTKGDILIKQDEVCKYLFVIGEGVLRNFVINKEGEDHTRWFAEDEIFSLHFYLSKMESHRLQVLKHYATALDGKYRQKKLGLL